MVACSKFRQLPLIFAAGLLGLAMGFPLISEAQSAAGDADGDAAEIVEIDVSPNPVGRGDRFTVTLELPVAESESITVEEPELPDPFSMIAGPYIRPVYIINEEGRRVRRSRVSFVYVSDESGRFELGSYLCRSVEGSFNSEPLLMEIGLYRNRSLVVPPDISWKLNRERVYVGQNVVAILEVEGLRDIRIFERVEVTPPAEGFFEPIDGVGTITRYELGGETLYRQPVAEYLFTPSTAGRMEIPRAYLDADGVRIQSDVPVIRVSSLPEEVKESGMVGVFRVDSQVDTEKMSRSEVLRFEMRISGTGNLNYLQIPPPSIEGWSVIEEKEEESFEAAAEGYRGYRSRIYRLSPESAGEPAVRVPRLRAVDPRNGRVYSLGGERFLIEVSAAEETTAASESDALPFIPREMYADDSAAGITRYREPGPYLWLLPGPLVFLFFLILRRRHPVVLFISLLSLLLLSFSPAPMIENPEVERGMRAYAAGEWEAAYDAFYRLLDEQRYCPDGRYNLSLAAYRLGRVGEAVFYARSAVHADPSENTYRRLLSFYEEELELPQHDLFPWPVHPDMVLLVLTLVINFAGFIGVFYLFSRRNAYFIAAAFLLVLAFAFSTALAYSIYSRTADVAVAVDEDVEVKTIPQNGSSNAFILKEGETVEIVGRAEPFVFVKTVLGRRGWIREAQLRRPDEF